MGGTLKIIEQNKLVLKIEGLTYTLTSLDLRYFSIQFRRRPDV